MGYKPQNFDLQLRLSKKPFYYVNTRRSAISDTEMGRGVYFA